MNAGLVKCVFCTCCRLHCSKSPTRRTSLQSKVLQWNRRITLKHGWNLTDVLATRRFGLLVKSLQQGFPTFLQPCTPSAFQQRSMYLFSIFTGAHAPLRFPTTIHFIMIIHWYI